MQFNLFLLTVVVTLFVTKLNPVFGDDVIPNDVVPKLHVLVAVKSIGAAIVVPGGTHVPVMGSIEEIYNNSPKEYRPVVLSEPVTFDIPCDAVLPEPNSSPACESFQSAKHIEVWGWFPDKINSEKELNLNVIKAEVRRIE